eukprot:295387-Prorocentrum_lima.AAC.1
MIRRPPRSTHCIAYRRQRQMCIRDSEQSASSSAAAVATAPGTEEVPRNAELPAVSYTHLRAHETRRHL